MEEPPGLKRKKSKSFFGGILRVGVVFCSISATVYYGGLCTEKYISNPATISSEMVTISELPPLRWSICKQVFLSDCKLQQYKIKVFEDEIENYDEANVIYDMFIGLIYTWFECEYEQGTFGLYANSTEEYWTQIKNYKLSDLVFFIDTWNETIGTWKRIFQYYKLNDNLQLFRSQMVLKDEQTGFWCHTLLIDDLDKIRVKLKGLTEMTYVVVHYERDIQSALKNMIKVGKIEYVSNVMVNVNAMKLSSLYGVQCSIQDDKCSEKLLEVMDCSLPFDFENDKPICKTHDAGLAVVKSRLAQIGNCQNPCLKLDIDYKEQPNKFFLSSVRPKYHSTFIESSEDEIGYIFQIPKYTNLISYSHEYSLPVALGYFGSIAGIFMGISAISVLSWFTNYINIKADVKKWGLIITKIGMSIYLLIISILMMNMFLQYPRNTSVNFVKTTSDFSMTICSSIQVYGVIDFNKYVYVSYDKFLMTNESFWLKWSDPRIILDTMKVYTGSYEIDLLDNNVPTTFSLLPVDEQTVAACHTFQMSAIKEIDSLTLIYNEEIQVYFHNTGQLLYEWDKRQNLIIPATEENVQIIRTGNSLVVYDLAVILKMEREIKLESDNYQFYDECVIDHGTETLGDNLMKCFFSKGHNNCTDIITNTTLNLMRNFLKSQNKCTLPTNILLTSADKSISLDSVKIKTEDIFSVDYDLTGSLGIKENSQAEKPKIEFFFPKFTKLSQEYFSYTVGSFLGEFGGLVGILLGLSFLDLQFFVSKLKRKYVLIATLYILCIGSVVWLLYEKIQIFVQSPTTASLEMIASKDIPISFTLCKIFYDGKFDGKFNSHILENIENVSIVYDNKEFEILDKDDLAFEFFSYLDYPMMCKEFDLANIKKDWIKFVRDSNNSDNNLHLYFHQPGMFYMQEFRLKYPSTLFRTGRSDDTNENAKVLMESYDISDDPHFPCSSEVYQQCVNREVIRIFNSSFGCTYPIQRELFGVEVCSSNGLVTLKNITKMVIDSEVCKLPCDLHYFQLHYLPGSEINGYDRTFTFYFDALPVNLVTHSKLLYGTWDYIYEIGGWIGLFLGYSVIGIFDDFVRFLRVIKRYIV